MKNWTRKLYRFIFWNKSKRKALKTLEELSEEERKILLDVLGYEPEEK